jgi:hypothetical protein
MGSEIQYSDFEKTNKIQDKFLLEKYNRLECVDKLHKSLITERKNMTFKYDPPKYFCTPYMNDERLKTPVDILLEKIIKERNDMLLDNDSCVLEFFFGYLFLNIKNTLISENLFFSIFGDNGTLLKQYFPSADPNYIVLEYFQKNTMEAKLLERLNNEVKKDKRELINLLSELSKEYFEDIKSKITINEIIGLYVNNEISKNKIKNESSSSANLEMPIKSFNDDDLNKYFDNNSNSSNTNNIDDINSDLIFYSLKGLVNSSNSYILKTLKIKPYIDTLKIITHEEKYNNILKKIEDIIERV